MTALLSIEDLQVSYGGIAALRGVTVRVDPGECVTILGPNGAGKSTLLRTVAGLNAPRSGGILMNGASIAGRQPEGLVADGISLVPEGRHVFGSLTVRENLLLGATTRRDGRAAVAADLERVGGLFPVLTRRLQQRAGQLSGGEQQMLAIGRALMAAPRLLLLDEPSLGLAPLVVQAVYDVIAQLRSTGVTLLVVEQNIGLALRVADRGYILNTGRVVLSGVPAELRGLGELDRAYFGGAS
jgi:branched-chain amino acid transport system ATP-binding protein